MACAATSNSKRSATSTTGYGLPGGGIAWKAPKLRAQHVGLQGCGLQFLPYAIHRIHGTNPFNKFGTCCHAGIHALPMGQAQASVIYLLALLPPAPVQQSPKSFLRGKFLGFALDRIQVEQSRCGAGAASAGRS